ncbi:cell division protein FtsZ [Xylophilus sp.]|uniref:cell division protein FtsZ n=1 Tax=Xylophilus sp. TaxID=2653893 RepID=UPI002D7FADF6|nr:cell division protein FtsZ [Xylophilus sp.]
MSDFQLSLAITGGAVIVAILVYNVWSSRRNAPRQARPEPQPAAGAAADGAPLADRQEPSFDIAADGGAPAAAVQAEPSVEAAGDLPVLPLPERRLGLDPLIDGIAPLHVDHVVSGDAALAALPTTRRAGSKPFAIEGLNQATRQWETPTAGQRYTAFQAGVQLANRTGALNDIEYSEFVVKAQAFADAIGAAADFPDMRHEVARARELDQFAGDHDAQLAFGLRARHAAWSPGYIQQTAARLGFVAGAIPGRLVLPAATAGLPPVLVLTFDSQAALADDPALSAIRDVALSLDVAQVQRSEQPFTRLREIAFALAETMDGAVTDQAGQPLAPEAFDQIGGELELLYDKLDSRELSAGSVLARRLFS